MDINAFEQLVCRASNTTELNAALTAYLADFGITIFSFTYYIYQANAVAKIKYNFASPSLKHRHEHHLEENHNAIDTNLVAKYREVLPLTCNMKFGLKKGLLIPIHGPDDDFASLVIEQLPDQQCLEKYEKIKFELLAASYCYYHYLKILLVKEKPPKPKLDLTKREMQIMSMVAQEYPVTAIAKTLGITERTVNFHIQRINKKTRNAK